MPRLVFIDPPCAGFAYELVQEKISVGRAPQNDVCLLHSSISREHSLIFVHGTEVIVRDLGSRNGTSVEGMPLHGIQMQVKHGQIVSFGDIEARLEIDDTDHKPGDSTAIHEHLEYLRQKENEPVQKASGPPPAIQVSGESVNQTVLLESSPVQASRDVQEKPRKTPAPLKRTVLFWLTTAALFGSILIFLIAP